MEKNLTMLNKFFTVRKFFLCISLFTFHFFPLSSKAQTPYNPDSIMRPTPITESLVYPDNDTTKPANYLRYYYDVVTENGTLDHGMKTGDWYFFNLDGALMFRGHYKNGLKDGRWEYLDSLSQTRAILYFKDGMADSVWTGFSQYGFPLYIAKFHYGGIVDTFYSFHETGNPYMKMIYQNGTPYKLIGQWDIYGNELSSGDFKFGSGMLQRYYPYGQLFSSEHWSKGSLNDYAAYLNIDGNKKCYGMYLEDKKVETWHYLNYDKTEVPYAAAGKENDPFDTNFDYDPQNKSLFIPAHYPAGGKGLKEYFRLNMVYPEDARKLKISGTVWLNFEVDELGRINDIKVFNSINEQCDAEAIYLASHMPTWMPALQQGIPVKSRVYFPVEFKLE